ASPRTTRMCCSSSRTRSFRQASSTRRSKTSRSHRRSSRRSAWSPKGSKQCARKALACCQASISKTDNRSLSRERRSVLARRMRTETVVFYEPVGHQKDAVSEAFFQEFKPDDLTCSRERVDRIRDLVLAEAREDFARNFLDTWDEA